MHVLREQQLSPSIYSLTVSLVLLLLCLLLSPLCLSQTFSFLSLSVCLSLQLN